MKTLIDTELEYDTAFTRIAWLLSGESTDYFSDGEVIDIMVDMMVGLGVLPSE